MMRKELLLFALCAAACGTSDSSNEQITAPTVPVASTFTLAASRPVQVLPISAELQAQERAAIRAKVPAFVRELKVDIGSRVRAGQVLAVLEAPELQAQVADATARSQSALATARSSKDKYDRLVQAAGQPGVVSGVELEHARNEYIADSTAAQAYRAAMGAAQDQSGYLTLLAPFNGVITQRNVNIGDLIAQGNALPLFELQQTATLRLRAAVPEFYLGTSPVDSSVTFTVPAFPGQPFPARLARRAGGLDPRTRSEVWEFEVDNRDGRLQGGMIAEMRLKLHRQQPSLMAPRTAVVTDQERTFVIRVQADTTAWVDVRKGMAFKDSVEIFGAVKAGEILVVNGTPEMRPGQKLK